MHHNIGAEFEGPLVHRRGEGIVYLHQSAVGMGRGGNGLDIEKLERRVGRGLEEVLNPSGTVNVG